jgi:putative intracellular protease/amidase
MPSEALMTIAENDTVALSRAASLLDTVGRNADAEDGLTGIHCLHAAELLASAGAVVTVVSASIASGNAGVAIREALRLLSTLSADTFAAPELVDAVDATQKAFLASGRWR